MTEGDTAPVLDLRDLHLAFGALRAVDGVSLTLFRGEIHALIGPNGAGKSTLAGLIAGTLRPDRGQILLAGQDIAALDPPARVRAGLALHLPSPAPRGTVPPTATPAAAAPITRAGRPPASAEPHCLARAAEPAPRPRAFVLDEPLAGIGPAAGRDIANALDRLRHAAPILLVEHDMDAVFRLADRISVLVEGRILASGPVAEIRADPEVRRVYLGQDARALS